MKLSPHFTLEEFTRSQTAARLGIKNEPNEQQLKNMKRVARKMERVRALLGTYIIVTSMLRVPRLNTAIGGSKKSQHMAGLAIDFIAPGFKPEKIIEIIKTSGIKYDQLINEFDQWVHFSIPEQGSLPRMQSFKIG